MRTNTNVIGLHWKWLAIMDVRITEIDVLIGRLATECTLSCIPTPYIRIVTMHVPKPWWSSCVLVLKRLLVCIQTSNSRTKEKKCVWQTPSHDYVWIYGIYERLCGQSNVSVTLLFDDNLFEWIHNLEPFLYCSCFDFCIRYCIYHVRYFNMPALVVMEEG